MTNKEADKGLVWYKGMVKKLGLVGLGEVEKDNDEFTVSYDPNLLTAHQAQELVTLAQTDGFFEGTYLDVKENKIEFRKGNVN